MAQQNQANMRSKMTKGLRFLRELKNCTPTKIKGWHHFELQTYACDQTS